MNFYRCEHCNSIITALRGYETPPNCCGREMTQLIPDAVDASREVHVPIIEQKWDIVHVKVGARPHPMIPVHYIQWVALETKEGCQIKYLSPGQTPEAFFSLTEGEEVVNAYAFCNLHLLWVND